jgi:hypothetical protein
MSEYEITTASMEDLESLYQYLLQEGLTGVRPTLRQGEPAPGEQGATEILTVLLTSGSGLALAQAVNAWVRTRQRKITLTWRRTGDGEEVSFESTGPDTQESLTALLSTGRLPLNSPPPSSSDTASSEQPE